MDEKLRRKVRKSLRDLIALETAAAQARYSTYNRKLGTYEFTDEMWRAGYRHGFNVVKRARDLLARL